MVVFPFAAFGVGNVNLAWNPGTNGTDAGYNVYYGTASRSYNTELANGTNLVATISGLAAGQTYYFAVTAVDALGDESDFSNEISYSVPGVNQPPTISSITNQTTAVNTATPAIAFTVGDQDTGPSNVVVSGSSSVPGVVPNANIVFGGSGANRTVTITPAPNVTGASQVTITASDGITNTSTSFTLTVAQGNTPPTISAIGNQTVTFGQATAAVPFTISDAQTAASSLTLTATSDIPTLVPAANVVFGGSGANRTVKVTPAPGQSGTANITVTVSDGTLTASTGFSVTVQSDTAPTISGIANQSVAFGQGTAAIPFTIGDAETAAASLTVSATSDNPTVAPTANVVFGGSGASRTVKVTPAPGQSGTANITVTVSDGTLTASTGFSVTVQSDTAPTISAIGNQTVAFGQATAAIPFTISDAETPAASLTVSATSDNATVVPAANVVFGGSGTNRTVKVTPATGQTGTADITVTVSDGTLTASTGFSVTVQSDTAPTISAIGNQSIFAGQATAAVPFTISDAETPAASLTVSATSDNATVVPAANVVFGGSGTNRTVKVTPATGQTGTADITVTVSDGTLNTSTGFSVTVQSNTPPTISAIANQTNTVGQALATIPFTVSDAETAAASLTVSATSDNTTVVPKVNIVFGGSGGNRTVTITPAAGKTGMANITVTVSDGTLTASSAFSVTVQPGSNTPPTITAIANQSLLVGQATPALAFTVSDAQTAATSLGVSATSDNMTLVPKANIIFRGTGASRTVTVTPAAGQTGIANITVTVSDGTLTASTSFSVTVQQQVVTNTPPTISGIANQNAYEGQPTGAIPFTIGDGQTAAASLVLSGTADNATLVPAANIAFGGSGAYRTVTVTPAAGQTGTTLITISVSDGVYITSTNFELTVVAATALPAATVTKGSYGGLFYESDAVRLQSAGAFKLTVSAGGKYSGSVQMAAGTYPFSGKFGALCVATNVVVNRKNSTPLTLSFSLEPGSSTNQFAGSLSDGTWKAGMFGSAAVFNTKTNPAPYAGTYTLTIPGQSSPSLGNGYGSLKVDGNGNVKFSGVLADGTKVTQSAVLSRDGTWGLFVPLYSGNGLVISWISFQSRSTDDLHGAINWLKQPNLTQHYYSSGLTLDGNVIGSLFAPGSLLALNQEISRLQSVGTSGGQISLLKVSASTGTLKGSILNPNGQSTGFQGALLLKLNAAYGFILETNQSAPLELTQ